MIVTNQMAFLFKRHVIDEKLSPYDALCHMKDEMPGQRIPCLSTWYKHINAGDVGVMYGGHAPPRARNQLNPPQAPRRAYGL